mmetsp:Transcript_25145/g.50549  ORF Transcript_25145/g.50549 Transcript_25145/m.50549 type:complete len:234 (-) Transcript_25145:227-928(-)
MVNPVLQVDRILILSEEFVILDAEVLIYARIERDPEDIGLALKEDGAGDAREQHEGPKPERHLRLASDPLAECVVLMLEECLCPVRKVRVGDGAHRRPADLRLRLGLLKLERRAIGDRMATASRHASLVSIGRGLHDPDRRPEFHAQLIRLLSGEHLPQALGLLGELIYDVHAAILRHTHTVAILCGRRKDNLCRQLCLQQQRLDGRGALHYGVLFVDADDLTAWRNALLRSN